MAKKRNAQDGWMALHQAHGRRIKALEGQNRELRAAVKMIVKTWQSTVGRVAKLEEPMLSVRKRR